MGIGSLIDSVAARVKQVVAQPPKAPAPSAPPPVPRPSTPESYQSGFETKAPAVIPDGRGVGGDPNALPEVLAARSKAAKNADVQFDVGPGSPGVEGLLRASPQIDANSATTEDNRRCVAASTFNAMLVDQRPRENAAAIEQYAAKIGYTLKDDEKAALASFKSGKLTPKEAGVLQECVFNLAKHNDAKREAQSGKKGPDRLDGHGVTVPGAAEVLAGLRAHGAMSTLKEVTLQMRESKASDGTPFGHATLMCQKADGSWLTVDTWPNKDGEATVGNLPTPMDLVRRDEHGELGHAPGVHGQVSLTNFGSPRVLFAYPSSNGDRPQLSRGSMSNFDPKDFKSGDLRGFDLYLHDLRSGEKVRVDPGTGTVLRDQPYVD